MTIGLAFPKRYQEQLTHKIDQTKQEFTSLFTGDLEVFESPPEYFRMRAEFKVWHDGDESHFAMYEPGKYKTPVIIKKFNIGSRIINELMPILLRNINIEPLLRKRLFQCEFLTSTTGEVLITLIYHKPLDEHWVSCAKNLEKKISCKIIGRSRKQKIVLTEDFIQESFDLENGCYLYQQVETGFTQPNAKVCRDMLNWAIKKSRHLGKDLLELYCGNGNFTLPLSKNFNKVLATEVSKTSIRSAEENIKLNDIKNINVLRMSSEEFTEAMNGAREFRRLKHLNLKDYNFSTIFVDPPRAGLDHETEKLVSGFDNIIYISCNPKTLHTNLENLSRTHKITDMALFDQFPYTEHRECGVLLKKNNQPKK